MWIVWYNVDRVVSCGIMWIVWYNVDRVVSCGSCGIMWIVWYRVDRVVSCGSCGIMWYRVDHVVKDRSSKEIEQRKESQNTHKTRTDM